MDTKGTKQNGLINRLVMFITGLAVFAALTIPAFALDINVMSYKPNTKTDYAADFVTKSEGQQWFLDEIERLLNAEQKTIDAITSASDLQNIRALGFDGRGIVGKIPSAIGELANIEYLFLGGNHLDGAIPASFFALKKLKNIDLSGNNYAGAIPSEFGTMASLETLILEGNKYTGNVPSIILNNTNIKVLNVKSNLLTGGVPAGINGMTSLEYLNMSDNALGGTIPNLGALSNLKALSLWNCGLTGEIHSSVYTLKKLQILDLAQGGLTGDISSAIGNLTDLQYLTFANNKLEGEIPDELVSLIKLQKINLSDNKLRGIIPDVFGAATIVEVHLENNFLRGTVPQTLKDRYDANARIYLMNNYLTGSILRGMANNEKNFTDGAGTEQYQLVASSGTVQVKEDSFVNIYRLLGNRSLKTGNVLQKVLLNPDEYTLLYDSAKFEVTVDATGIHVKALTEVSADENATIVIYIKDNNGSDYSKVTIKLTTGTVTGGGGGFGGGAEGDPVDIIIDDDDTPLSDRHTPYINGFPDGTFLPENDVTREQVAKMVVVALGLDVVDPYSATYSDVPRENWSYTYVETATERGYLKGFGDGTFGPGQAMTRAELATCLVRVSEQMGRSASEDARSFTDVEGGEWYADYVIRAAKMGLVNGYEDGTFEPNRPVSRAEAVTMINRMLERNPATAGELKTAQNPFNDIKSTHWAYMQILEASVEHNH